MHSRSPSISASASWVTLLPGTYWAGRRTDHPAEDSPGKRHCGLLPSVYFLPPKQPAANGTGQLFHSTVGKMAETNAFAFSEILFLIDTITHIWKMCKIFLRWINGRCINDKLFWFVYIHWFLYWFWRLYILTAGPLRALPVSTPARQCAGLWKHLRLH